LDFPGQPVVESLNAKLGHNAGALEEFFAIAQLMVGL